MQIFYDVLDLAIINFLINRDIIGVNITCIDYIPKLVCKLQATVNIDSEGEIRPEPNEIKFINYESKI